MPSLALLLAAASLLPQISPEPQDLTLPPETAHLVTILEGRGVQIYTCTAQANGYTWTLTAPEAQLFNLATGKQVGQHGAGPTWNLDDGSSLRGTVLQKRTADTAADVPWLLLKADTPTTMPASAANAQPRNGAGMLAGVTYIRRYNTHGGAMPAMPCDAAGTGAQQRVPYTATYAFYATPGAPSNLQQPAPAGGASPSPASSQP